MPKEICKFNPLSDIEEVVPELGANIAEIMATGTVVGTSTDTAFTKETDIKEVGHYLRDKIEVAMAAQRLGASMARADAAEGSKVNPEGA